MEPCSFRLVSNKFGKNFSLAVACESLVKLCGKLGVLCGEKELSFKFGLAKFCDEFAALLVSDSAELKDRAADGDIFCA